MKQADLGGGEAELRTDSRGTRFGIKEQERERGGAGQEVWEVNHEKHVGSGQ